MNSVPHDRSCYRLLPLSPVLNGSRQCSAHWSGSRLFSLLKEPVRRLAGTLAFVLDLAIGALAPRLTNAPQNFPPFTVLPVLSGTFGGAILAAIAYSLLKVF